MSQHVCEHLRPLEDYLVSLKRAITYSGQAWSSNCRFWVYFDAVLDCDALRKRFPLGDGITVHVNDDSRSGREKGLVCEACKDAVIGLHPVDGKGGVVIS